MLNKEKYKDELEKVLADALAVSESGEICRCEDIETCGRCIFFGADCVGKTMNWLNSEYKEITMLTEEEKAYITEVIKPFRDVVRCIKKLNDDEWAEEYICICIEQSSSTNLPRFAEGMAYKNMENGREYTLEELGL